jgi:hypothetical protein
VVGDAQAEVSHGGRDIAGALSFAIEDAIEDGIEA